MVTPADASRILDTVLNSPLHGAALRRLAMEQLDTLDTYNWSGIYRLEGDTLVLDEYVGAETDHTHIPVGRGVCGTAVAEGKNQVIKDVRELSNYLACSLQTRSELVVLIYRPEVGQQTPIPTLPPDEQGEGQRVIIGQIDIDGHQVGAFDASDEGLLTKLAEILAERWE
ncbi:MAG: GAF domain-containing protein [Armatimonadetes bacterium]|nr:GAF domain-containing protein [Armatimonadota bacterium]MBS1728276.1 GAF domain-containing protein [Armatimonadota bacterium]